MRILNVFGFFGILCANFDEFYAIVNIKHTDLDVVKRECKTLENYSTVMRLKKHLFCKYDFTVRPNYPNTTNITLSLMPSLIDMNGDNAKLTLQSLIIFSWTDTQLTWTPSDYDEISFIKIKSWQIWTPHLIVNNSADMSNDGHVISWKGCILFNSGFILCVPMARFISKCNSDYTYWPYDKHKCSITFISWTHEGEEVDLVTKGVNMSDFMGDLIWDFKYLNYTRETKKYKCCPNDTFPRISYNFLLTRHGKHHLVIITLVIASILLTLTVLCLDLNSVERIAVASVNFIYHLLCMHFLHWNIPYNGVNPPNIMLFYRESLGLASFAIILTAFLRKLENMSTEVPNWISFITTFVLSYKAGRFLIFKDDESKIAGRDTITEGSLDLQKSEIIMKKLFWKYFAAIIDWLSFFCVIITYIISLIILVPED